MREKCNTSFLSVAVFILKEVVLCKNVQKFLKIFITECSGFILVSFRSEEVLNKLKFVEKLDSILK